MGFLRVIAVDAPNPSYFTISALELAKPMLEDTIFVFAVQFYVLWCLR